MNRVRAVMRRVSVGLIVTIVFMRSNGALPVCLIPIQTPVRRLARRSPQTAPSMSNSRSARADSDDEVSSGDLSVSEGDGPGTQANIMTYDIRYADDDEDMDHVESSEFLESVAETDDDDDDYV